MEPEFYPCVTVFFSDIVNFTHISSVLAPREVCTSARSQGCVEAQLVTCMCASCACMVQGTVADDMACRCAHIDLEADCKCCDYRSCSC